MAQGEQSDFPLLTNCKLTINSKVVGDTEKLYKLLTNEMKFKIAGIDPLIIEKDDPSQVDIEKVFDGIRSLCKGAGSFVDLEKTCEICFDQKTKYPLKCCGKYLCQDCEKKMANCPFCRRFWRVLIGDQPPGTMAIHDGFWEIKYSFPSGVQELTNCKLTINSKVVVDTEKLYKLLTNELKFKIIGFDPLIIEKDDPSQVDIGKVFDGIRSLCKGRESRDETVNPNVQCNVHDVTNSISLLQTGHTLVDHYQLVSRSNNVNSKDVTQQRSSDTVASTE